MSFYNEANGKWLSWTLHSTVNNHFSSEGINNSKIKHCDREYSNDINVALPHRGWKSSRGSLGSLFLYLQCRVEPINYLQQSWVANRKILEGTKEDKHMINLDQTVCHHRQQSMSQLSWLAPLFSKHKREWWTKQCPHQSINRT